MLKGENLNTKLGVVLLRQLDLRGVTVICEACKIRRRTEETYYKV